MGITPGPWRSPYVDSLPNGLRAVRIDSSQSEGISVVALLPVGSGEDLEINAIQQSNAAAVAAVPELIDAGRALLADYMDLLREYNTLLVEEQGSKPTDPDPSALTMRALLKRIEG